VIHQDAASIDVGSRFHVVAVGADRSEEPVRTYQSFTGDLERLADWLDEVGITTVAMESTGVYWIPKQIVAEVLAELFRGPGQRACQRKRRLRLPLACARPSRVLRDAGLRPAFERGDERFLRQILGEADVANHAHEATDHLGRHRLDGFASGSHCHASFFRCSAADRSRHAGVPAERVAPA
jgi:hypothetical protein